MNRIVLACILSSALLALNACSRGTQPEKAPAQPVGSAASQPSSAGRTAEQARRAEGFALFNKSCRVCHGTDGNGNGSRPGPSLQRGEFSYGRSREAVLESIRNGRQGGMPAYGTVFSASQIEALADYVISLKR